MAIKKQFVKTKPVCKVTFSVEAKDATLVKTDSSKEFCNVCGMNLTNYYKTNHVTEFKNGHKEQYCSLHCQAQIHEDHEDKIKNIQVIKPIAKEVIKTKKVKLEKEIILKER